MISANSVAHVMLKVNVVINVEGFGLPCGPGVRSLKVLMLVNLSYLPTWEVVSSITTR